MENNVYLEVYDPLRDQARLCLLEVKEAKQLQLLNGQLVSTSECFFFLNQILVVEGSFDKETGVLECRHIIQGITTW